MLLRLVYSLGATTTEQYMFGVVGLVAAANLEVHWYSHWKTAKTRHGYLVCSYQPVQLRKTTIQDIGIALYLSLNFSSCTRVPRPNHVQILRGCILWLLMENMTCMFESHMNQSHCIVMVSALLHLKRLSHYRQVGYSSFPPHLSAFLAITTKCGFPINE